MSSKLAREKGVVFKKLKHLRSTLHCIRYKLQARHGASGPRLDVKSRVGAGKAGRWWRRLPAACMPTGSAHGGGFLASRWEEWWCGLSKATWQLW